jgi:hypothetical protein
MNIYFHLDMFKKINYLESLWHGEKLIARVILR